MNKIKIKEVDNKLDNGIAYGELAIRYAELKSAADQMHTQLQLAYDWVNKRLHMNDMHNAHISINKAIDSYNQLTKE